MINRRLPLLILVLAIFISLAPSHGQRNFFQYRTYNGLYNDLRNFQEGKANIPLERMAGDYNYPKGSHYMVENTNPRLISNMLCNQDESIPDERGLSSLVFTFLQFIDHDITATAEGHHEYVPIDVPVGDTYFDPFYSGQVKIPFTRSAYMHLSKSSREQINTITAWLDGSVIYGSDEERAKWLRSGECGKLKVSPSPYGDLLPCNTVSGDCNDTIDPDAPSMAMNQNRDGSYVKVFVAGDIRANEQPGLTALHTLFVREHNRICDELAANGSCHDEKNYQYARKVVGGILQSILYNELLPALGVQTGNDKYDRNASPNIFNSFATAAFRLGHTMVTNEIPVINNDCGEVSSSLALADAFFNPSILMNQGVEGILRGLYRQTQEKIDLKLVHGVRNFLFGPPGAGGLDLAAMNIQRGRDHGLPFYNTIRDNFGMKKVKSFAEITADATVQKALKDAYGSVEKIDAWIGMLAEDKVPGTSFGPTLHTILSLQFRSIKQADRFYYTRDYQLRKQVRDEITETKISDVIKRNTDIGLISRAFFKGYCDIKDDLAYCDVSAKSSRYEWIEEVNINDYTNRSGNDQGYGDYTQQSIPANPGQKINLYFRGGFNGIGYNEHWQVWVDVNRDGDFSNDELMYSTREYQHTFGSFVLPSSTDYGPVRMRVIMSYYEIDGPCGKIKYGEVEDYVLSVQEAAFTASARNSEAERKVEIINHVSDLYPNPSNRITSFVLQLEVDQQVEWSLVGSNGQTMISSSKAMSAGTSKVDIDLTDLTPGIYHLIVRIEKSLFNRKLIKI